MAQCKSLSHQMIRKPLPTDRTVDGAEVITDCPHGPLGAAAQALRGHQAWGRGLTRGKIYGGEKGAEGVFFLVPVALLKWMVLLGFLARRFSSNILLKNIFWVTKVLLKNLDKLKSQR